LYLGQNTFEDKLMVDVAAFRKHFESRLTDWCGLTRDEIITVFNTAALDALKEQQKCDRHFSTTSNVIAFHGDH
jgi:hypothetical protein